MNFLKVNTVIFAVCMLLLAYIAFYQPYLQKIKINNCTQKQLGVASSVHDLKGSSRDTVEDVYSFLEGYNACMAE